MFGLVSRVRRGLNESRLGFESRLRAEARLRETYDREIASGHTRAGESRYVESSFVDSVGQESKPAWAQYFLDDWFTQSAQPKPDLEPIPAEFTYEPVPRVEVRVSSVDEGWALWDEAQAALDLGIAPLRAAGRGSIEPESA